MSEDSKKAASAILTENEEALFQIMKIVIATVAAGDPVKGKQLLRFAREALYPVPPILDEMGLSYDEKLLSFRGRG